MCGIVGYVGKREAKEILIEGLKRLEYRGYDSAGISFFQDREIRLVKSEGKIKNIEMLMEKEKYSPSHCGIGHTRWATHGKPTTQNAHPHRTEHVVLVHNGIIENYQELKIDLLKCGYQPNSETDSELYGYLILEELKKTGDFTEAVRSAFLKLEGSCSVVVMSENNPGLVIGIRNGSPLVCAKDPKGGAILASDAQALLSYTQDVIFLENNDMVIAKEDSIKFLDVTNGKPISRESTFLDWSAEAMDKQGYPHYMLKEIYEQPQAFVDTLNGVLDRDSADPFPLVKGKGYEILTQAKHIVIVACGTSWHAALLGKYWLERWTGIPVSVDWASEYRYRAPVIVEGTIVVSISQSGETADSLAVLTSMKKRGIPTLTITNVRGSTMSRESDAVFYTCAGPEIAVASTKSFMTQMLVLVCWAGCLGSRNPKRKEPIRARFDQLLRIPHLLSASVLPDSPLVKEIKKVASRLADAKGFFFVGRGYSFPLALEGALKLKEIAYVPAEGYPAGELKHGPLAMIDQDMVAVVLAPDDTWREKTISNLQEVRARGARVLAIGNPKDEGLKSQCDEWLHIPLPKKTGKAETEWHYSLYPFLLTPMIQLLSYEIAVLKGTDIDQPRNLAKSVTVE